MNQSSVQNLEPAQGSNFVKSAFICSVLPSHCLEGHGDDASCHGWAEGIADEFPCAEAAEGHAITFREPHGPQHLDVV